MRKFKPNWYIINIILDLTIKEELTVTIQVVKHSHEILNPYPSRGSGTHVPNRFP